MNSKILEFFNIKLDAFIVFMCVVLVVMFIALFFLLLDYLKIRKKYMEFMTGESGKSLEYTIYKRFREIDELKVCVIICKAGGRRSKRKRHQLKAPKYDTKDECCRGKGYAGNR